MFTARPDTLTGDVVNRSNPQYDAARVDFNRRFPPFTPRYVVFCESVRDVQDAVRWARSHRLPIRARSGRHSYEAYSLVDGGVIIDVSRLDAVVLDKARGTAEIGAGANLGQVYDGLWDQGMVTIPGGSCVGVGIAGLTLGGGFGLLVRLLGLTCDAVVEVEMVDACGDVLRANASVNPDLFWASCGGGGGNFGVVTRFTFRVTPIGNVTAFQITWPWDDLRTVFEAWQAWADPERLDDRATPILTLPARSAGYVSVLGEFVGPFAELDQLIQPLLRAAKPLSLKIVEEPYIEAVHRFVGDPPGSAEWAVERGALRSRTPEAAPAPRPAAAPSEAPAQSQQAQGALDKFKNTSAFVFRPFDRRAVDTMVAQLERAPSANDLVQFNLHGGAEARRPDGATAYPWRRGVRYSMQYQAYWSQNEEEPAQIRWVEGFRRSMLPFTRGAYVNYIDRDIRDWPEAFYDRNLPRLLRVKRRYDPDNVFDFPQGLGRLVGGAPEARAIGDGGAAGGRTPPASPPAEG